MKIRDFEEAVYNVERVRIVVRAARGAQVEPYHYEAAYPQTNTVRAFLDGRVRPKIGGYEVSVIGPNGVGVPENTKVGSVRDLFEE